MKIQQFTLGPIEENCYVVSDEGEAAIVDCGCFAESEWTRIKHYIDESQLTVKYLLCTHLHFDHVLGNGYVQRDYDIKPMASYYDEYLYTRMQRQMAGLLGESIVSHFDFSFTSKSFTPLVHGNRLKLGNDTIQVIATPGHTPGGLCFYLHDAGMLLSGDTLFQNSIGRTDLEGGNYATLIRSITQHLLCLPPSTTVYSGHGPSTTIEHEMNYNPYV